MLSYRHAFHAGNHADVLKHLVQMLCLERLLERRGKPLAYFDTHAGAGMYDLADARALKNAEFSAGIGRLWDATGLPAPLARYREVIRGFNADGELHRYPGSPAIARALMPAGRLELCELHPDDHRRLVAWAAGERRIHVAQADGFARLKALLPPVERRALVLLDPPYEVKEDYARVARAVQEAGRRFATGVYVLWYPLLAGHVAAIPGKRLESTVERWLRVELEVLPRTAPGMYGSGVFLVNPPWQVAEQLEACREAFGALLCTPPAAGLSVHRSPATN